MSAAELRQCVCVCVCTVHLSSSLLKTVSSGFSTYDQSKFVLGQFIVIQYFWCTETAARLGSVFKNPSPSLRDTLENFVQLLYLHWACVG